MFYLGQEFFYSKVKLVAPVSVLYFRFGAWENWWALVESKDRNPLFLMFWFWNQSCFFSKSDWCHRPCSFCTNLRTQCRAYICDKLLFSISENLYCFFVCVLQWVCLKQASIELRVGCYTRCNCSTDRELVVIFRGKENQPNSTFCSTWQISWRVLTYL